MKKVISVLLMLVLCVSSICSVSLVSADAATNSYENRWEQSMSGATGWVVSAECLKSSPSTGASTVINIPAPTGGTNVRMIKFVSNRVWSDSKYQWVKVSYSGKTGYIRTNYILINLPDVLPNIQYNITNAYSSIFKFKSTSNPISGVTGRDIYDAPNNTGKVANPRSSRGKEYIAPMNYRTALKVAEAYQRAINLGYNLKIYDTYRPAYACDTIRTGYSKYKNYSGWANAFIGDPYYGKHSIGCALDVTLVNLKTGKELSMPSSMHDLSTNAQGTKYVYGTNRVYSDAGYPSSIKTSLLTNDLKKYPFRYSNPGVNNVNTYNANLIWYIMTNNNNLGKSNTVGSGCLTTIACEWWHFEDLSYTYSAKTGNKVTMDVDMRSGGFTNFNGRKNSNGTYTKSASTCQRFNSVNSSSYIKLSHSIVTLNKGEVFGPGVQYNHNLRLSFSTTNSKVATVDTNGNILGVGKGTCEMIVKNSNGDKTSCIVVVK